MKRGRSTFSGRTHLGAAFLLWLYIVLAVNVWLNPIPMLIGSLFPDSDHPKAPMGRILPLWLFFKHRGFTHRWYGMTLFTAIIFLIFDWKIAVSFSIGYTSHLFLDQCTASGAFSVKRKRKKTKR